MHINSFLQDFQAKFCAFKVLFEQVCLPHHFVFIGVLGFLKERGRFICDLCMLFPHRDVMNLEVSQIHSSLNDPCLFEMAKDFEFPSDLEVVVPCLDDMDSIDPIGFTTIYVEQLRVGLCFPLFHLLVTIRNYYRI